MKKINKNALLPAILSVLILFAVVAMISVAATGGSGKDDVSEDLVVASLDEKINPNVGTEAVGLYNYRGKIQFIHMPEYGGYGPSTDWIDANVVVGLYGSPKRFGFKLINDQYLFVHQGWLDIARDAFRDNRSVSMDVWLDPAKNNGMILRLMEYRR